MLKKSMKYSHRFKIGNLSYAIYTDSLKLKTFFLRAYSLFDENVLVCKSPAKNIVINAKSCNKRNINKIILDTNMLVLKNLIENLRETTLFLHASCVIFRNKYLFFLGESLQGKSTAVGMLKDRGGIVLSDDTTLIEYQSYRALRFPAFANVRNGEFTALQEKYLEPIFKKFNEASEQLLSDMSDKEFKAYYLYNRALYSRNGDIDTNFKKIAIVLKKDKVCSDKLEKIDFPASLNVLINSLFYVSEPVIKKNLKHLINISSDMDFYSLESSSAKEALELLSNHIL